METDLVKIDDDYYLIIPDDVMEKCGFEDTVRICLNDDSIIISKPEKHPSNNW